ncbi:hypothetical protein ACW4YW_10960 [Methylobacillus pratensis]
MDTQYYKDHSVQVVFKAADDIGFIWLALVDGRFVGPPDQQKFIYETPEEAKDAGWQYAAAHINDLEKADEPKGQI